MWIIAGHSIQGLVYIHAYAIEVEQPWSDLGTNDRGVTHTRKLFTPLTPEVIYSKWSVHDRQTDRWTDRQTDTQTKFTLR